MLSPEQLERRKLGIGSSEMASVMGLNPYQSAYDVYLLKVGLDPGFEGNDATRRGDWLEEPLMRFAEYRLGHPIQRSVTFLDPDGGPLAANLDGLMIEREANIEGKSLSGEIDEREWGDHGSDAVPNRTIIQTHVAMICAKLKRSYVPVVLPIFRQYEFRLYCVEFNQDLAAAIRVQADAFWKNHVLARVPPSDSVPSLEVLKRIKRTPETFATVSDELMDRLDTLKLVASGAEKSAKEIHAAVLAAMQPINADGIRTASGRTFSYLEQNRKGFTVEPTSFRVLREIKAKRKS